MTENSDFFTKISKKEDIQKAIQSLDKGLFPGAFCKIVPDIADRTDYCSIFHSDGAGTKSSLAYMYYKETEDVSVFKGIVRDAMIMNIDDILCVGATGNVYLSNIINRNNKFISGEIIAIIIKEYNDYCKKLAELGLNVVMCGGETADLGDLVKTIIVDASVFTTMKKEDVIDASNIKSGDVIVGLASYGKASYEEEYNSGIGSNGFTLARHGTLSHTYYEKYNECYDRDLEENLIFFGQYELTEPLKEINLTVGKALLSPTRTYTPIIVDVLKSNRKEIHGIIHNTGGGQTKNLNFGKGIKYVKDNPFKIPKIFEVIQRSSKKPWKEMYQIFNMGHRMELLCHESIAKEIIRTAKKYNVDAKVIGRCEKSSKKNENELEIKSELGYFNYN